MYENFHRIPPEEQQRILQVCIEEFAAKGYTEASTNTIVNRAGIPKGTLFFYFGSKKDLYLYVIDEAVARYTVEAQQSMDNLPSDLFERLIYLGKRRMRFAQREPQLYRLLFQAFLNTPDDIKAAMRGRFAAYAAESQRILFAGLDLSRFKPAAPVEQVVRLINLVLEGLLNQYTPALQQMEADQSLRLIDRLSEEAAGYFELIKSGVYKTGTNRE